MTIKSDKWSNTTPLPAKIYANEGVTLPRI